MLSPLVSSPVNVGMKADPSAPPAIRTNNVSDTRLAARKASISGEVPNVVAFRIRLARLAILLNSKAIITLPAERAIWRLAVSSIKAIANKLYPYIEPIDVVRFMV